MTVTIPDVATATALAGTAGWVELKGPDGRLLGRFLPAPRPGMMFPEFGMTDDEIEQHDLDPNARWVTADDVSARLRSLRGVS